MTRLLLLNHNLLVYFAVPKIDWFASGCEVARMRTSTFKSEAMVLSRKLVDLFSGSCSQVRGQWGVRWAGGSEQRERYCVRFYRIVVTKRELSQKAKLSIHWSVFVPTLIYGHEG